MGSAAREFTLVADADGPVDLAEAARRAWQKEVDARAQAEQARIARATEEARAWWSSTFLHVVQERLGVEASRVELHMDAPVYARDAVPDHIPVRWYGEIDGLWLALGKREPYDLVPPLELRYTCLECGEAYAPEEGASKREIRSLADLGRILEYTDAHEGVCPGCQMYPMYE